MKSPIKKKRKPHNKEVIVEVKKTKAIQRILNKREQIRPRRTKA
jgi:hypothetical protein